MNCTRWRILRSQWSCGRRCSGGRIRRFGSTMNRLSLCLLPLLLLTAGCFSAIDDEDYKAFTADRWGEMIKDNENRLKPEEQRPIQGLENPLRALIGAIAEGMSWIHDLATGHNFVDEVKTLLG